jgi:hypothetical protein
MADEAALAEERQRLRRMKTVVDLACAVIAQGGLARAEAEDLVAAARSQVLALFPDKEATYELVLAPRFRRLIAEFTREPARVLPFRRP